MLHNTQTQLAPVADPRRRLDILRFWHKVEFFIPFDLQKVLDDRDASWSVRRFSKPQLARADARALWRARPPADRRLTGFDAYLGAFDKSELVRAAQRLGRQALASAEDFEQSARAELEGLTCFARIGLDGQGAPLPDDVSVSTVPWALGRTQRHGLEGLDFDAFTHDLDSLKHVLADFRADRAIGGQARDAHPGPAPDDGQASSPAPLAGHELLALLEIFCDWAGFRPEPGSNAPLVVIRARSTTRPAQDPAAQDQTAGAGGKPGADGFAPGPPSTDPARAAKAAKAGENDGDDEDDEPGPDEDAEIDILNSFYIRDIARAIRSLRRDEPCPALTAYLSPLAPASRLDLYGPDGQRHVAAALAPSRLNRGHWLEEPRHAMSLMQQFAIQAAFEQLREAGVFSVNGPPGTGKTTLLRDLVADNVTRRARALARLDAPGDAFRPEPVTVHFDGAEQACRIAVLREELVGFEMVVASSNNAAVENVSRELPKTRALGRTAWRDQDGRARVGYLQPVARHIAALTGKGAYLKLDADDEPWGLVACVLGRKANRLAFAKRLSFDRPPNADKPPRNFDPALHQSIWTWRDRYQGVGFEQARRAFQQADQAVERRIGQLEHYAKLRHTLRGQTEASYTAAAATAAQRASAVLDAARETLAEAAARLEHGRLQLDALEAQAHSIEQAQPGWWARWLRRGAYRAHEAEAAANRRVQAEWRRRNLAAQASLQAAELAEQAATGALRQAQQRLSAQQALWDGLQEQLAGLAREFPLAACPDHAHELEQAHWQIGGLWRDETLDRLRAELFAAALALHQAWLAQVLQRGGRFGPNVVAFCNLLSGKRPRQAEHALAVWQSLFMVVPVVSTTLASYASQFQDVGPSALGWLFIDEAGQAVPQAAVGALWRTRRAVVVGDPLQIEPVFTVPIGLIEQLAESSGLPPDAGVEPHRASVQVLADAANRLGARVGERGEAKWIGSPLRVHRRCVDPMFSLANAIAYEGRMIFSDPHDPAKRLPPPHSLDIGPSAWVHAPGKVRGKQCVPQQVELVLQALQALVRRTGALPPLFIVSPFKQIRQALVERIRNPANWRDLDMPDGARIRAGQLRDWCDKRIGTVHTFQGKEEDIVWMVLGCDAGTRGAAAWAAGKPNLLNVALTRAKHRFFAIGDADLWGGLPYFGQALAGPLPRTSPDAFLRHVGAGDAAVEPEARQPA